MATLTTTAAVKAQLNITSDSDDAIIDDYVTQASVMFQVEARRQFYATPGATLTYDYAPPQITGLTLWFLEDVLDVDRIINGDGSVITRDQFRLLPVNGSPKYAAQILTGSNITWLLSNQNNWQSAIHVHGTIGYNATNNEPGDVRFAVTKLASWMYQTRDNNGDVIRFADGSTQIPANAPAVVLRTAKNYKRVQIYT